MFKFGIIGAGFIAHKFIEAVSLIEDCEVVAVCDLNEAQGKDFAKKYKINKFYKDNDEMLAMADLDAVYIATTPNSHYALSLSCLEHKIPVICEKSFFLNSKDANKVFEKSREMYTFCMEGLWSLFLPANKQAKEWIDYGKIGKITSSHMEVGVVESIDPISTYLNPRLGGGAAYHLSVYGYGITTMMYDGDYDEVQAFSTWMETNVDVTNHVVLKYPQAIASFTTSYVGPMDERLVIYGNEGRIEIPNAHFASECILYNSSNEKIAHFKDQETKNGFVYEIEEVIRCVRAGKIESSVVPHSLTIGCAQVFDLLMKQKGN